MRVRFRSFMDLLQGRGQQRTLRLDPDPVETHANSSHSFSCAVWLLDCMSLSVACTTDDMCTC